MAYPTQVRDFGRELRWQPCKNVGATTISAYGCVEVTGITDDPLTYDKVWTVRRPTSATPAAVAANGPGQIVANAFGVITFDDPFFILVDAAVTPAVGTTLGPAANQFDVDTSGSPTFIALSTVLTSPRRCLARWNTGVTTRHRFGRTTSTITAASGTTSRTLGSGTVDLFTNSGTSGTNTTTSVTAYNTMGSVIDTDTYVQLTKFDPNGDYFITAVDCA